MNLFTMFTKTSFIYLILSLTSFLFLTWCSTRPDAEFIEEDGVLIVPEVEEIEEIEVEEIEE